MSGLTIEQEEEIKIIRANYHKTRLLCERVDLLLITYEELEAEREKNKQLFILCDLCKEKDK